jgi:hypothetical protein
VLDLPLAQPAATPRVAVAIVRDEVIGAHPWSPASGSAWDPDALHDWCQLRTVMALPGRNDYRERSPFPVAGQVELGS